MKKILRIVLILAAIAALVLLGMKAVKSKKAKEASAPTAKIYPLVVQTMTPKISAAKLTLPYLAVSENEADVALSSRIASRVESIKKSGESVKAGEVVARLDTTDLTAKINAAKIALKNQIASFKRTQNLYKVKGASVEQLQKQQSAIASLRATLKTLQNQLSYTTLTAPTSGIITKTMAAPGDIAMPGKALLKISSEQGFSLLVRLPDSIKSDTVIFRGKTYPLRALGSTFQGLNEYKAYVDAAHLTAGETTEIRVVTFEGMATKLPFDAILDSNGKSYVLTIDKEKALPREVHIMQKGEEGVVIKEDLSKEKIVVAKPDILLKLLTGISVKAEG
jgi:multidrug efflux pump subunit AcrA (membrane-fusion protein)